jgi:hypothetical protein
VLGTIRLSFFLLSLRQGEKLGIPICEKRSELLYKLAVGKLRNVLLSPATWAKDESWDYHTLIYMLNYIIRI